MQIIGDFNILQANLPLGVPTTTVEANNSDYLDGTGLGVRGG